MLYQRYRYSQWDGTQQIFRHRRQRVDGYVVR